ncbi:MAG: hypothetical protein JWQ02_3019, partial [Capsulimonas sp.]|nr:hypothetical protein [Capsulimonas sp.]
SALLQARFPTAGILIFGSHDTAIDYPSIANISAIDIRAPHTISSLAP